MTKVSSEMRDQIRSLWRAGHCISDIRGFLWHSGVYVSTFTVRRHCYCRRRPVAKKTTLLKMNSAALKIVDELLHEDNERSAKNIQSELQSRYQLQVSISTIRRSIKQLGWTYGKARIQNVTKKTAIEDVRPELTRLCSEIEALKQQSLLSKAAHATETEALRKELQECKDACANTTTALEALNNTVLMQLREAQTALVECRAQLAHTSAQTGVETNRRQSAPTFTSPGCHPDLEFPRLTPEHLDVLFMQSCGRPDRYGCLVFRFLVSEQQYAEWASTTNWDGSRGKIALPMNLRQFVTNTVSQRFSSLTSADRKRLKDRVNEFLRCRRNTVAR